MRNLWRSSSAENSSSASGLTLPSIARDRSAERSRLLCSSRSYGVGSGSASPSATSPQTARLVGAVVGHQGVLVEAELLQGPLGELLDAHPLLGADHLVAVDGVHQLVVLAGEVAQGGPDREQLLLAVAPRRLDRGARLGGLLDRHLEPGQDGGHRHPDGLGGPALADQPLTSLDRPGPRLALGLGGPHQRVGTTVQRAGALLAGAQRESGVHLGLARGPRRLGQPLTRLGVGLEIRGVRRLLRGRQSLLELGEPREVLLASRLGGGHRLGDPLRLGTRGATLRTVVAELLGDSGERGVGLVELGERDVDPALGVLSLGLQARDVEPEALRGGDRV